MADVNDLWGKGLEAVVRARVDVGSGMRRGCIIERLELEFLDWGIVL